MVIIVTWMENFGWDVDEEAQKLIQDASKYLVQAIDAMKPDGVPTESWKTLFRNIPSEIDFQEFKAMWARNP